MTATTNRPTTTPLEDAATGVVDGTATTPRARKPILAASGGPAKRPSAAAHLTDADVEQLGKELDALRDRVIATRGAADAAYIRRVIRIQRTLEVAGRATLLFSKKKTAFVAGKVRDLRTGEVHGDEGELIQTCVNAAAGPVHLDI